ncbi:multiubiquitin domain-containing protein [Chitinophaga sp. S165]|uniref:multiubiquitin domain-containing protein n=1 Tax=Chitinophaga sp. S165 TaxID=2135462 RepID=UPI000D717B15|nr:multiubiquitin domain-containing protein [Chitinophaga sp. S165]PWV47054.1 multiubiquitin [Chitinophaga sp. S165]
MKQNDLVGLQRTLELIIEGKKFTWTEQYITGAQVRKLGNLSPEAEIYLRVQAPWKDEPVLDDTLVDLARPEVEHFYVLQPLEYTINGVRFESRSQYINGNLIHQQASIPRDHQIYLAIQGPWDDELIGNNDFVDLARPGIEHFYSKEVVYEFLLWVNGKEKVWKKSKISYSEAIILAYGEQLPNECRVYTVTYKKGPEQNPEGSMIEGDVVFVKSKMIINVSATDKS